MCPLCLTTLAVPVTASTGIGAAAVAAATRVAKSITRPPTDDASAPATPAEPHAGRGGR